MGLNIDREYFEPEDFQRFQERLHEQLQVLEELLERPAFGQGEASLGAELEMHLVDRDLRPSPVNVPVQARCADARVTLELNRFNLELNARPTPLAGRPFSRLDAELRDGLQVIERAAGEFDCRLAVMGILPTLRDTDLGPEARTDLPRYNLLSRALREQRGGPFEVRLNGQDPLVMQCDDVTLEGANTAYQVHLRVPPAQFADCYNAAQLATSVVLAASGNSPLFVGHRLWEETRIALFKQAVDARTDLSADWHRPPRVCLGHGWVGRGALELFRQSVALHPPLLPALGSQDARAQLQAGRAPSLDELRLHHGSVWSWNRAVYDPAEDGHLRIELRALPAGPTLTDMLANTAFALGLTLGLAPTARDWTSAMPFELARRNLYRGAEQGLEAELVWPAPRAPSPQAHRASSLALSLLPVAASGLRAAGLDGDDYEPLLEVVRARVISGRTGARWQREQLDELLRTTPLDSALARLLERYLELAALGHPVHTW